jgi:serine/threonine protein phosphatase PrpC
MTYRLNAAAGSEQGPVRPSNQDAVLAEGILFAVSDGFGAEGGNASRIALETLASGFADAPDRDGLLAAAQQANDRVWSYISNAAPDRAGASGATLTAIAFFDEGPVAVNVGDSPLNRIRDGQMQQLTNDHSVSGELVRVGEITRAQARVHPQRHLLVRALGIGPRVRLDVRDVDCLPGDRLLISSDGLFAAAEDSDVLAAALADTPEVAVQRLIEVANEAGGSDNTSVVVIDIG